MTRIFPKENLLPDLSDLTADRYALRMVDAFTGDRGRAYEIRVLMSHLARLVDRALRAYRVGSEHLDNWISSRPTWDVTSLLRATSFLEECIDCTHRASRFAEELANRGVIDGSDLKVDSRIKDLRDAVQHLGTDSSVVVDLV